jgi:hypothetical protein
VEVEQVNGHVCFFYAKDALDARRTIDDIFEGVTPQKGRTHIIIKLPGKWDFMITFLFL